MITNIRWRSIVCAVGAWSISTLAFAGSPAQSKPGALTDTIKVGDTVSVTRWSGGTLKGEVTASTDCVLRVRDAMGIHQVSLADMKAVRRHKARKINGAAAVMLDIANRCDETGCVPAAMASAGIGALVQGIDELTHPPKVVYRSKTRPGPSHACAPATLPLAGPPAM